VRTIRIPGKVMLSGEYAVLFGGSAVALPVPRHLTVEPAPEIPAGGYPPAAAAAFACPVPELDQLPVDPPPPPPCRFDHHELRGLSEDGTEIKLGLGSSAAEAVGTVAWRYEAAGLNWEQHKVGIARSALAAHSHVQHGLGSGYDVLVCAYGEGLRLKLVNGERVFSLLLPADTENYPPLALVHTGVAANTRTLITRFLDWHAAAGTACEVWMDAACFAADALAIAWSDGDWPELLSALDTFEARLKPCLDAARIPYMLPAHEKLAAWARERGGRAKPTGAGGGDMALLIGDLPYHELGSEVIKLSPRGSKQR
jgi:phosphomevalonate kinase